MYSCLRKITTKLLVQREMGFIPSTLVLFKRLSPPCPVRLSDESPRTARVLATRHSILSCCWCSSQYFCRRLRDELQRTEVCIPLSSSTHRLPQHHSVFLRWHTDTRVTQYPSKEQSLRLFCRHHGFLHHLWNAWYASSTRSPSGPWHASSNIF